MIVTNLGLANVRGIEAAEFSFQPGLNLIVGANGAGKTTVLDALAICLEAVTRRVNGVRGTSGRRKSFSPDDINVLADALYVRMRLTIDDKQYAYEHNHPRESVGTRPAESSTLREQTYDTRPSSGFTGSTPPAAHGTSPRPFGILFSTRRAVPDDRAPSRAASAGGQRAALADAFGYRELRLPEFAAWLRTRETLAGEAPTSAQAIDALERAVERFLPGYSNLRVTNEAKPRMLIEKQRAVLPVAKLSDGERGMLALVFDLTRRLAQANPGLEDPAADGTGVVLIDEIDLHLHPKWQRTVVKNLPATFPGLQFIATTHSPQVIGEVLPDRIQVMGEGPVFSPTHSYGVDSNRVLEEIMNAPPRTADIQGLLKKLSDHVTDDDYAAAWSVADELRSKLGDNDSEVLRVRTLLEFLTNDE
jgi:AAA domain, putative AbiEii toxin, Type IV TA system/AAA domain